MIKLVIALGNQGVQYAETRHNIGWLLLEHLSYYSELSWQSKFKGELADYSITGKKILFLKPHTFMNLSGESLSRVMKFYKLGPEELVVLHDDLELSFGVVAFKWGGGLGGHNGLRSITAHLGTKDFARFRVGISKPAHSDITSYVLGNFSQQENADLPFVLNRAAQLFEDNFFKDFKLLETGLKKYDVLN